jgi:hypothetical protein
MVKQMRSDLLVKSEPILDPLKTSAGVPGLDIGEEKKPDIQTDAEDEGEEEEYIDEGDQVIVPWGAAIPGPSSTEVVEEEEGAYSEDEAITSSESCQRHPAESQVRSKMTHG